MMQSKSNSIPFATTPRSVIRSTPDEQSTRVTFGSLNNFCKVNPAVLKLWAGVLNAVERSRLLLLAPEGSARRRVLEILEPAGISADRVTFVPRQSRQSYLMLYNQIDIGLDTFILSGYPHLEECYNIGEELLPRLREVAVTVGQA
jgi:predicted O-linked N-acetylglucosamine transferase (SPINDLY family)